MKKMTCLLLALGFSVLIVGCGTAPTPTPPPTVPPIVITVIITATLPPETATSAAPTITRLPTLATTETAPAPTKAAAATSVPRATATLRPPTVAATATTSPIPIKFGAPTLNRPLWTENQKDEVKFPGGAIILDWQSVGGLGGDECYLVQITTEPTNPAAAVGTKSDYWITNCGDQTQHGFSVKMTLESPNRIGPLPNYASLLLDTNEMWANWSITVVKNLGQCEASYVYHCKWAPIGHPGRGRFLFKGG
jgi:hypothetical protein